LHHFQDFDLGLFDSESPMALNAVERSFWLDLWRAPVLDAVVENGIETRRYGPLQATVIPGLRGEPLLNLLLGADEPGAVEEGHLEGALGWMEELEVDCRVPVGSDGDEAAAAEELLNHWGYRRTGSLVRLVRDTSPPAHPVPEGVEVVERKEFTEGFGEIFTEGYGLCMSAAMFFDCLPERDDWRCYLAFDEQGQGVSAAAMMPQWGVATHLGFASTLEEFRGGGLHRALLDRCIRDAASTCPTVFAETIEPLGERDGPSPGCRNLLRAGFRQASARTVWRPGNLDLEDDSEEDDFED
jgi:GNAT superfamily N-acetyltransferase